MDIYAVVTDRIIATIEAGQAGSWRCPWHRRGGGLPVNALTGKTYKGVNILSLWASEQTSSFGDARWATYRQWSELGAQVRKGEKSTLVVFYKDYVREDDGEERKTCVARASWAFNASQVDGASPVSSPPPIGYAEHGLLDDLAVLRDARVLEGGETACYVPSQDLIRMPSRHLFMNAHGWSSTLAHELVHWTGAPTRLARDLTGRFKSSSYAAEELVAELGTAFLMGQFGMASEPHPQHAAYISHWLPLLKADSRAIFTAASAASKAADYLARGPDPKGAP